MMTSGSEGKWGVDGALASTGRRFWILGLKLFTSSYMPPTYSSKTQRLSDYD